MLQMYSKCPEEHSTGVRMKELISEINSRLCCSLLSLLCHAGTCIPRIRYSKWSEEHSPDDDGVPILIEDSEPEEDLSKDPEEMEQEPKEDPSEDPGDIK
ncbi:unnamed protein product [Lactuca saligna]|uniref:Uncharacterized protein n=1 Tax=Lactuca saligna TaxID=75948 RepID=A0AA36E8I2_LACSI|nr:unnamed protein product [Lactuca saligna]